MENVILLGTSDRFTPKAMKIFHGLMALILIIQGLFRFFDGNTSSWGIVKTVLTLLLFFGGLYYLFLFFKGFSKTSSFAPKVRLTEQSIEFKVGFFRDVIRIKWSDLKMIEMKSYKLIFHLSNTIEEVNYTTTFFISKEIKKGIMEFADAKGVLVT